MDLPTSNGANGSFFKKRELQDQLFIAAATPNDEDGESHTIQIQAGRWHTLGTQSNILNVEGNSPWLSILAQSLASDTDLPAFAVGFDRQGLIVKSRITAVNINQKQLTIDRPLIFDAASPGDFVLAFALPDALNTGANSISAALLLGEQEYSELELRAMSSMLVDSPDMDGVSSTHDPTFFRTSSTCSSTSETCGDHQARESRRSSTTIHALGISTQPEFNTTRKLWTIHNSSQSASADSRIAPSTHNSSSTNAE